MQSIHWLQKTSLLALFLVGIVRCSLDNSTEGENDIVTETILELSSPNFPTSSSPPPPAVITGYVTVLPTTTDVCGLSLISPSEQDSSRTRKCRCSDFDEEVDCSHLEVTQLPKLLSFPKSARDVSFQGNNIRDIDQDTFYSGKSVQNLDLSHNQINFVSIVAFRAFKNLRRLDLSHNKIWNMPTKSLEGLSSLKFLDLGYNDLIYLSSDMFASVPNLTELDLDSNPLKELEPKVFQHLRYLEVLNLEATLLKVIPDHVFLFTPRLRLLDLSSNQLIEVPTDALRVLDHLKLLDLSGNPISVIDEEAFIGMRNLALLYLDRMPFLRTIEKYAFGDLEHLQELHCSYNFLLSEVNERAFIKKSNSKKITLSQLFLRQTALTSLSSTILDWNENIELHISDIPLYCDCHSEWMLTVKLKNNFQKHVKCAGPGHFLDMTLEELKSHEMPCGMEYSEIVLIILASVAFLLILVLIIAFIVWRRSYPGYDRPGYFKVSKKKRVDFDERVDDGI